MKKLISQAKWKTHLRRRSKAALKRSRKMKAIRLALRRTRISVPTRKGFRTRNRRPEIDVSAPPVFSLVDHPDEAITFLDELLSRCGQPINVKMDEVQVMTPDAAALMLSAIKSDRIKGLKVRGSYPAGANARKLFIECGLDSHVEMNAGPVESKGAMRRFDSRDGQKKADGEIASELLKSVGIATGRGPGKRCYSALLECMQNTWKHAGDTEGVTRWLATAYTDSERGIVVFSFIDSGLGIFNSFALKQRLKAALGQFTVRRPALLRDLLGGKIPSRTGVPYRGKGLPRIKEDLDKGRFKRLVIVSNDVFADVGNGVFRTLKSSLKGTFLYWEVQNEIRN